MSVSSSPLRLDVFVQELVIVECKATSRYNDVFEAQTLTYVRLMNLKSALQVAAAAAGMYIVWVIRTDSESTLSQDFAQRPSGERFDLSSTVVDIQDIRAGGPPKDGIPALSRPGHIKGSVADYLKLHDRVIGVVSGNAARAYPLRILNYHEIVNDTIGKTPIAVTYCPLCDSAAVYDRRTPLGEREFGVSGLLFNSNVLMYDRRGTPESLWSQVRTTGISGPGADRRLTALPCELTTWESWLVRVPDTLVLSIETGHQRDYLRNPYDEYFTNQELMFPVSPANPILSNKERILGVWVGNQFRAFPESAFPQDTNRITEVLADKSITVEFDRKNQTLRVVRADDDISWLYSFWFAWYAFHPDTTVYGR
ncbi:MAG: DUF3179 domain-containing (seleno)protein [Planctomycetota bacterium]|nr:DUF3179 domain-containing (seleno)protein [Planctomycetota bacterium]